MAHRTAQLVVLGAVLGAVLALAVALAMVWLRPLPDVRVSDPCDLLYAYPAEQRAEVSAAYSCRT